MHGLNRELYRRTIRRLKWAGGEGFKEKIYIYLHEKLYVKRKCIKTKQAERHEPARTHEKKNYTLKQKIPQPLLFSDVGKNAGVLKHTIANPIKKS